MEVDVRSIVQSAIQVGSTTTKLQDCGNLTMRSQWQIHRTQWCFSIACIWLISLDFCFSAMGQATWNRLYLYNASTHAALTSPQYLMPLVWEQHLKCNFLCGCFLFGRHTVSISFLIIITVLGIVVVWPLPVFTHHCQGSVIFAYLLYVWVLVADSICTGFAKWCREGHWLPINSELWTHLWLVTMQATA